MQLFIISDQSLYEKIQLPDSFVSLHTDALSVPMALSKIKDKLNSKWDKVIAVGKEARNILSLLSKENSFKWEEYKEEVKGFILDKPDIRLLQMNLKVKLKSGEDIYIVDNPSSLYELSKEELDTIYKAAQVFGPVEVMKK